MSGTSLGGGDSPLVRFGLGLLAEAEEEVEEAVAPSLLLRGRVGIKNAGRGQFIIAKPQFMSNICSI